MLSGKVKFPSPANLASGPVTVGIRSQDVQLVNLSGNKAVIHEVENHGVENIITLRARDVLLKATASSKLDLRVESEVGFVIDAPKAHYFDPVSGMNMVAGAASSQKKGRIR